MKLDSSAFVADKHLLEALEKCSSPIACRKNLELFMQCAPPIGVFILRQGQVHLSMASQTGGIVLRIAALPGSVLGLPGVMSNQPYSLTARASRGARLGFVTREDFSRILLETPELSMHVLRILAAEVRSVRSVLAGQSLC